MTRLGNHAELTKFNTREQTEKIFFQESTVQCNITNEKTPLTEQFSTWGTQFRKYILKSSQSRGSSSCVDKFLLNKLFWLTLSERYFNYLLSSNLWSNLEFPLSRQRTWFDVCLTEWHHGKGMELVLVSASVGNHRLQGQFLLALQTVGKDRSKSNQGTADPQKEKDYNGTNYLKTKGIFILLIRMHVW